MTDEEVRASATKHFDWLDPLLEYPLPREKVKYLYITVAVHFAKHEREEKMTEQEQLELKRISNERILNIDEFLCKDPSYMDEKDDNKAFFYKTYIYLDAQLQADQQVLDNVKQAIFDEIEEGANVYMHENIGQRILEIPEQGWQALKKKWSVKYLNVANPVEVLPCLPTQKHTRIIDSSNKEKS